MADDLLGRHQVVERRQRVAGRGPGDLDLLGLRGVIELDQEHEPVELRLGQGVRPLLLDRVLRGQDQERRLEAERLADDRDVLLLHRLEHRRLRLRWGPVDLVG